jgi:uncharacterized RDD family membrane protein YckC
MKYAGFGPRLLAGLIDFIILLPLLFFYFWVQSHGQTITLLIVIPYFLAFALFNILFLAKCGRTPGKMVMHITITKVDGGNIGYREAFLRHSVDLVFAIISSIGIFIAIQNTAPEVFSSLYSWNQRTTMIMTHNPTFAQIATTCSNVWIWSELIVLLLNKKRRAIHDFIAGTVVIHDQK